MAERMISSNSCIGSLRFQADTQPTKCSRQTKHEETKCYPQAIELLILSCVWDDIDISQALRICSITPYFFWTVVFETQLFTDQIDKTLAPKQLCDSAVKYAFLWAIKNAHFDIVERLYFQTDITLYSVDLLFSACYYGHLRVFEFLGPMVDITVRNNQAVQLACGKGHLNVVQYLIHLKADITARENRALQLASENGHLEVVQCLLENKADGNARDNHALQLAQKNGHLRVVQYLTSHNT